MMARAWPLVEANPSVFGESPMLYVPERQAGTGLKLGVQTGAEEN